MIIKNRKNWFDSFFFLREIRVNAILFSHADGVIYRRGAHAVCQPVGAEGIPMYHIIPTFIYVYISTICTCIDYNFSPMRLGSYRFFFYWNWSCTGHRMCMENNIVTTIIIIIFLKPYRHAQWNVYTIHSYIMVYYNRKLSITIPTHILYYAVGIPTYYF